jgi:hypothetical protein
MDWRVLLVLAALGCAKTEHGAPASTGSAVSPAPAPVVAAADAAMAPAPDAAAAQVPGTQTATLEEVPLVDLVQLLSVSRKTGRIRVTAAQSGELYIRGGAIYHAAIGGKPPKTGRDAAIAMLRWKTGTFEFVPGIEIEVAGEIKADTAELAMEAVRQ